MAHQQKPIDQIYEANGALAGLVDLVVCVGNNQLDCLKADNFAHLLGLIQAKLENGTDALVEEAQQEAAAKRAGVRIVHPIPV